MAKIHKMIVYFLDVNNEGVSMHDAVYEIRNLDVGCGMYTVIPVGSGDMGEWHDDHVLNNRNTSIEVHDSFIK